MLRERESAGQATTTLMHAVATAVDEVRIMHAYRRPNQITLFDKIDITQIEAEVSGQKIVKPLLIRAANDKSIDQLSSEINAGQRGDPVVIGAIADRWLFSLSGVQFGLCCGEQ